MTDVLQVGVANEDVLDVQDRLRFLGYYDGQIHGEYDTATEAAVTAYQHAVGESATGALDEHGVRKLRAYSNAYHYGKGGVHADYSHHDDYHGHVEHHHHGGHAGHVEHHGDFDGNAHHDAHQHGHREHPLPDEQGHVGSPVEEDVVVGNAPEFYSHVLQTITNVEEHALLLGKLNDDAYLRGVTRFQQFIEGRIAAEESDDALNGHVAMQVARTICDAVGIWGCGKIVWPAFQWIAEQISMGIAHSSSKIAFTELATGDAKRIRAFYTQQMIEVARERAVAEHVLHQNIRAAFQPVRDLAQRHKPLPEEHNAWIAHAYENGGTALDEVVEGLFGIQGTAKLAHVENEVYVQLYNEWYKAKHGG